MFNVPHATCTVPSPPPPPPIILGPITRIAGEEQAYRLYAAHIS
jgi:hypothetical protein